MDQSEPPAKLSAYPLVIGVDVPHDTAAGVGAVANAGGVPSIQSGADASKPAAGTVGRVYVSTDLKLIRLDNGTAWDTVAVSNWADLAGKPATFPPSAHASSHHSGGSDALSLGSIAGTLTDAQHGNRSGGSLHAAATTSTAGFMSAADKAKLDGIQAGAEVNQNAFSNILVGGTTVAADTKTDTVEFVAGANIQLTPDAANDKITFAVTGVVVNAGATPSIQAGTIASRPVASTAGRVYFSTDEKRIYRDDGTAWQQFSFAPPVTQAQMDQSEPPAKLSAYPLVLGTDTNTTIPSLSVTGDLMVGGKLKLAVSTSAPPAATAADEGKLWLQTGSGTAKSKLFVCMQKVGTSVYEWVQVAVSN